MRTFRVLCVSWVLSIAIGNARAEGPPDAVPGPSQAASQHPVAFGTNLPLLWKDASSIAASLYVGVYDHHAIRANVATYESHEKVREVVGELAGGDGVGQSGRITDLGIGWVYYPQRLWDGWAMEAGVLRRARDVSVYDSAQSPEYVQHKTTVYAARAMLGWSWLIADHAFVAVGAGLSIGRESGSELSHTDYSNVMTHKTIERVDVTGEAYLRVGIAFAL